jgi:ABC-type sugar transport system ATPase subunit
MADITLERVAKTFHGASAAALAEARRLEEDVREAKLTTAGGVRALDAIDLRVLNGETISVIGPSGCGKSTLLRAIAGLEPPDSGRVLYDGKDMMGVAPGDRGIGMVFQNYALYPHMQSRNNLAFFFRMHKRELEIDERVRITSEIMGVGFDQLLDRKPKTLSGGQQQRVAIARCIVRDPKVFLFDEPLSNLDAKLRARTRVEVKRLLNRFRITAVYVTHDQVEAIALADRIAVMRQGRIEQIGTYHQIYDRPVNAFVAGFVGSPPANFLSAVVDDGHISFGGGSFRLPSRWRPLVSTGQEVLVGVRPEHFRLGAPGSRGDLNGTVDVVEPLIAERAQLIHVRVPSGNGIPADVTVRLEDEAPVARGDAVPLTIDVEKAMLFDREGARSLLW